MMEKQDGKTEGALDNHEAQTRTRRDFLKAAGTTVGGVLAASLAAPEASAAQTGTKQAGPIPVARADSRKMVSGKLPKAPVMATGRAIGANDRIHVAILGIGGMGGGHLNNFLREHKERNIQIVGVSDVYTPRLNRAKQVSQEKGGVADVQADKDYRRLLENKDIDAVLIATPEHWHAQMACHAMEAGKHVYIQKPMTRYLDEAFQIYDTAMKTKKVVQVGSQGCSDMRFHAAGKAVREGKVGQLVMGQDSYTRPLAYAKVPSGEWNYTIPGDITPETLDWKMWLGSAPDRPFATQGGAPAGQQPMRDDAAARFARYRKYWDYSAGIMGDLMPHRLHPFLIASGNPEFPTRVSCIGTRMMDDREVDDTIQVVAEFPSKWTMLFVGSTVNEQGLPRIFRGSKATIYFGEAVEIRPERPFSEEIEGGRVPVEGPAFETHENHEKDWLISIRTGKTPNCNIDLATKVQTIISLAEMSSRLNKTMLFDEKTRTWKAG